MKISMGMSEKNLAFLRSAVTMREVAVAISATLLFFFTVLLVPMLGFFVGIFTPLPTLLFYYRWGLPFGYLVPGGSLVVGMLLLSYLGMAQSIPYFLEMLSLGILLGIGMRRHWSPERVIGSASLFVAAVGILGFWISYGGGDGNIIESLEKDLREAVAMMLQHYGGASAEKSLFEHSVQAVIPILVRILPGAGLSSALIISWLNVLLTKRYCRTHHLPQPPWGEWSQWKAPELLVWTVVASGLLLLLPFGPLKLFGLNGLIVLGTIYLFQGLAIATFYFERWHLPRFLRALGYGILLLQQFATLGAIFMGLFDVWLDFRRLSRQPSKLT